LMWEDFTNPFTGKVVRKSRVFIPSKLSDNRYLGASCRLMASASLAMFAKRPHDSLRSIGGCNGEACASGTFHGPYHSLGTGGPGAAGIGATTGAAAAGVGSSRRGAA
jgi:hypothetical protein